MGGAEKQRLRASGGIEGLPSRLPREQPFSRPASACLCVLRGTAAGQRPSPMQPRTERPAGRTQSPEQTGSPGPLRRLRRRRRRPSLQREWARGLGLVTG